MSPTGRPKGEHRSAQHEGTPVSPTGRPKGEHRSAQREGTPVSPPGRPKGEHRSAQHEGIPVSRAGHTDGGHPGAAHGGDPVRAVATGMEVTVVWATPLVQDVVVVTLPPGSDVAAAVSRSGFVAAYGLDLDRLGYSVDGRRARLTTALAHGNRVDLAPPLKVDPKSIRRLRAEARPLRPTAKPERRSRA